MQGNYVFFCCKYSDLDNMLPVLFALLEANEHAEAAIYWYGKTIKDDSSGLLRYAQRSFSQRLSIWVPSQQGFSDYGAVFSRPGLLQRLRLRWHALGDLGHEKRLGARAAKHLLQHYSDSVDICFIGFSGREFLAETAARIKYCRPLWVRLPQGVRLAVSAFRTVKNVSVPSTTAASDYLPVWADEAIDVDRHMYTHCAGIYERLGSAQQCSQPALLGAPRFSHRWIKRLDEAFADVVTEFSATPVQRRRILFLLTPWHKNVWREEVLRVLDIVAAYDVSLVIKGFHANTSQDMSGKGLCIDESSPTSALIRDADAVLYIATSAALDGYMRGKEMLQLSYLHGNQTSLEKYGVGVAAQCRDDVHLRMQRFVQTGSFLFDGEEERKVEAERFVHAEIVGEDPMRDYSAYLHTLVENRRLNAD